MDRITQSYIRKNTFFFFLNSVVWLSFYKVPVNGGCPFFDVTLWCNLLNVLLKYNGMCHLLWKRMLTMWTTAGITSVSWSIQKMHGGNVYKYGCGGKAFSFLCMVLCFGNQVKNRNQIILCMTENYMWYHVYFTGYFSPDSVFLLHRATYCHRNTIHNAWDGPWVKCRRKI